ncbi:TPA: ATPase/kinase [Aquificae Joseph's Coat Spring virus]|nr:TPA: ATPase/kinase [Aquificae Joseph's Coat Spring virus]
MKLALCGYAGSGKTTLAKYFIEHYDFKHISFAKTVKDLAKKLFPELKYEKPLTETERYSLIAIAEAIKTLDLYYWVKQVENQLKSNENIVLDDLRFKFEEIELRKHGFHIIMIYCPKEERAKRLNGVLVDNHENEIELITPDLIVAGNDVEAKAKDIIRKFGLP